MSVSDSKLVIILRSSRNIPKWPHVFQANPLLQFEYTAGVQSTEEARIQGVRHAITRDVSPLRF